MATRILVIEDNQANLDLMIYLLEAFGYGTLSAKDGDKGLTMAAQEEPDLIICDVHLPKVDGYRVAVELKHNPILSAIPLLAVTAFAMVGDRDRILASGFDGYIAKPIVPETFVRQVVEFLRPEKRVASKEALPTHEHCHHEPIPSQPAKHRQILVVDDSVTNRDILRSTLEPSGYEVALASSVSEALYLIDQRLPDLIISDLNMPGRSGLDFIQAAKSHPRAREVPFVLISSTFHDAGYRRLAEGLGACRFIFRPVEPQVLLAQVESCLGKRTSDTRSGQDGQNFSC